MVSSTVVLYKILLFIANSKNLVVLLPLMGYLYKGLIAGVLVSAPLGPIGVLQIQKTMFKGVRSGIISGQGIAVADTFYAIVAGFGLTFLTNFFVSQAYALNIIGGIVLFIFGIKMIKAKPKKESALALKQNSEENKSKISDFFSMLFLTVTNPFTIVMYGIVFTFLGLHVNSSDTKGGLLLTIGVYLGASIWWYLLTSGISMFKEKIKINNFVKVNKIIGFVIIGFALYAALKVFA